MDFVEAVRRGCEQTIGGIILCGSLYSIPRTACVLGAALLGLGLPASSMTTRMAIIALRDVFPVLSQRRSCPVPDCCSLPDPSYSPQCDAALLAVHLNDDHRWQRMRIAHYIQDGDDSGS